MASTERYYLKLEREKEDERKKGQAALQWLVNRMDQGPYEDGIIAAHRQDIAYHVAEGLNEMGSNIVEQLTQPSDHSIETEHGSIHLVTNQIDAPVPPARMEGPAVIVDADEKIIEKIEDDGMIEQILVIHWPNSEATSEWIEKATRLTVQEN
jgi:hypothetical protein